MKYLIFLIIIMFFSLSHAEIASSIIFDTVDKNGNHIDGTIIFYSESNDQFPSPATSATSNQFFRIIAYSSGITYREISYGDQGGYQLTEGKTYRVKPVDENDSYLYGGDVIFEVTDSPDSLTYVYFTIEPFGDTIFDTVDKNGNHIDGGLIFYNESNDQFPTPVTSENRSQVFRIIAFSSGITYREISYGDQDYYHITKGKTYWIKPKDWNDSYLYGGDVIFEVTDSPDSLTYVYFVIEPFGDTIFDTVDKNGNHIDGTVVFYSESNDQFLTPVTSENRSQFFRINAFSSGITYQEISYGDQDYYHITKGKTYWLSPKIEGDTYIYGFAETNLNITISDSGETKIFFICAANSAPMAVAQNITVSAGPECSVDVSSQQVDNGSSDPDGDSLSYVLEPSGPYPLGENQVSLIVSDGELSDTSYSIITVTGGSGNVTGSVTLNGIGLTSIIVKLLENDNPTEFIETSTNAEGAYSFNAVPLDSYQVMIVVPLGYILDNNFVPFYLECGATANVNFDLNEIVIQNHARSKGYWKHQFDVYVKDKGNAQETAEQLQSYIDEVQIRYTLHFNLFNGILSFENWQTILSVKGNAGMETKAKSHVAALALNIMSSKIFQSEVVTDDGYTAGNVLTFVSELILDGDGSNDELAKDLAESVCNQQTIASGIVNPSQNILYKGFAGKLDENLIPTEFGLLQNYPNPFNPETRISYALPIESYVNLTIYDISGRVVTNLVDRTQSAGVYQVTFNGSSLTSGIYFYVIKAGSFNQIKRMILIK